jgi:hypothetical protein
MENHMITEQQLLDFIEGKLSTHESRSIKDVIASSGDINRKYQRLLYMQEVMSKHALIKTSDNFLETVMAGLETRKFSVEGLFDSINKLGLKLFLLISVIMVIAIYLTTNGSIMLNLDGVANSYDLNTLPVATFLDDKLIVNGLLFSGLMMTLFLFDKVILKPWFSRRRATSLH